MTRHHCQTLKLTLQIVRINHRRDSGLLEQVVAHGAAGRAVFKMQVVRRSPLRGIVRRKIERWAFGRPATQ